MSAAASDPDWFAVKTVDRFIEAWNTSCYRRSMAMAGTIGFRCDELPVLLLSWDAEGRVTRLTSDDAQAPVFFGTRDGWNIFFEGSRSATMTLLSGALKLEGPLRKLLPYSIAFNRIAEVMRLTVGGCSP